MTFKKINKPAHLLYFQDSQVKNQIELQRLQINKWQTGLIGFSKGYPTILTLLKCKNEFQYFKRILVSLLLYDFRL